jgi:TPR repeat protein
MMRKATIPLALAAIFIATAARAQSGTLTMGFGDVAAPKRKAEAGDAAAQVALGDTLASHSRASEALQWYRKAAVQSNAGGEYHVGHMLLFGGAETLKPWDFSQITPGASGGRTWLRRTANLKHATTWPRC